MKGEIKMIDYVNHDNSIKINQKNGVTNYIVFNSQDKFLYRFEIIQDSEKYFISKIENKGHVRFQFQTDLAGLIAFFDTQELPEGVEEIATEKEVKNEEIDNAIRSACDKDNIEILKDLQAQGVNLENFQTDKQSYDSPIEYALAKNSPQVIKYLLVEVGVSPLTSRGNIISKLIKNHADIDLIEAVLKKCKPSATDLLYAVNNNNYKIADLLVKNGADTFEKATFSGKRIYKIIREKLEKKEIDWQFRFLPHCS